MEILAGYKLHHGPRYSGAGIKIQIHYNQSPGIYFKVEPSEVGYRRGIEKGLQEDANLLGPDFLKTASIWIIDVQEDAIDSSEMAFYRAARLAINQALFLRNLVRERK